ncbi:LOW QUALITY PROTEIN: hypothetical protein RJ639_040040 [Escallonia herrerae]|uniref:Uncharacterized protein n=1 Tax=Escallonia herrerae TaxID=1293975 RepID=A0AA89BDA3_9ASTE|nr:LOW QUALITY PROTEIN: hypothetical protein RJ639_040040 [Escallonia herrerae]
MVCPGGEHAFISRIIEDSVQLKQSFRWYTSMVGRKSNLKTLISHLRSVGVSLRRLNLSRDKHACGDLRGLLCLRLERSYHLMCQGNVFYLSHLSYRDSALSIADAGNAEPQNTIDADGLITLPYDQCVVSKYYGLQRQYSAVFVLQAVESFFCTSGASCKLNLDSFYMDV